LTQQSASRSASASALASPTSGYGPAGVLTLPHSAAHSLRAIVARLAGCLGDLPERLRLVLELRTGLGVPHVLSRSAAARYLHVPVRQVAHLERRALRLLRLTARTHDCRPTSVQLTSLGIAVGPGGEPGEGGAQAVGGVMAARYAKLASPRGDRPASAQGGSNSLGIGVARAGDVLLAILLVLAGMLVIAVLFAEELGLAPRYRRWQERRMRRPPP
jgi:hypothetical protein